MPEDPALARAAALSELGHRSRLPPGAIAELESAVANDPDARVRSAALGALVRAATPEHAAAAWRGAVGDSEPSVRRRAADSAPALAARTNEELTPALVALLDDAESTVIEAAAWALGEMGQATIDAGGVAALARTATDHTDPLAREAAVAAIGALGDEAGLPAVLQACTDKPAIRRRAVLALAPFEGEEVERALRTALEDKDWQVRQAAEDLLET